LATGSIFVAGSKNDCSSSTCIAIIALIRLQPSSGLIGNQMAFVVTFSALLIAGVVWMGLFMALRDANSALLRAAAQWLSPDLVSGWFFYFAFAFWCFWRLAQRTGVFDASREPRDDTSVTTGQAIDSGDRTMGEK
jgi:ABC-type nickel/cobalt efflux system permease component RcnA